MLNRLAGAVKNDAKFLKLLRTRSLKGPVTTLNRSMKVVPSEGPLPLSGSSLFPADTLNRSKKVLIPEIPAPPELLDTETPLFVAVSLAARAFCICSKSEALYKKD